MCGSTVTYVVIAIVEGLLLHRAICRGILPVRLVLAPFPRSDDSNFLISWRVELVERVSEGIHWGVNRRLVDVM